MYSMVFGSGDAQGPADYVLKDLSGFCRERESCFNQDHAVQALLEGRREVILRIRDFTTLSVEELMVRYAGVE